MNKKRELPSEFLALLQKVTGKRSKIVVNHILEHGFITTEDLERIYGYKHPPRAIRDVREQGIPLETFRVKNNQGRNIAAYRFGDITNTKSDRIGGRKSFPKKLKKTLIDENDSKCAICSQSYGERYLQIDHRIPYEIAGETTEKLLDQPYMLLCGSCNRAKSWSCEHCPNRTEYNDPTLCKKCYWATPDSYEHIALQPIRRLDVVWNEDETNDYERLLQQSQNRNIPLPDFVKEILKKHR